MLWMDSFYLLITGLLILGSHKLVKVAFESMIYLTVSMAKCQVCKKIKLHVRYENCKNCFLIRRNCSMQSLVLMLFLIYLTFKGIFFPQNCRLLASSHSFQKFSSESLFSDKNEPRTYTFQTNIYYPLSHYIYSFQSLTNHRVHAP